MKKFIIIIVLAFLQSACATSPGVTGVSATMLSFDAIGAEISVAYESLEEPIEPSQTVAMHIE